jgi:hypothetical protein
MFKKVSTQMVDRLRRYAREDGISRLDRWPIQEHEDYGVHDVGCLSSVFEACGGRLVVGDVGVTECSNALCD